MALAKLILDRTCRIRGEHVEEGSVVELDGIDPKTGDLVGEARTFVARKWAHLPEEGAAAAAGKKKSGEGK